MFSTCESSDDLDGAISGIRTLRDLCKENVDKITSREPVIYGLLGAELRVEDISTSRGVIPIRRAYLRSSEYHVGWVLDGDYPSCMICDVKFSFNRRRHHCRACGCLVCNECSMSRATIVQLHNSYRFRVCDICTARCSTLENWNVSQNKGYYDDSKRSEKAAMNNEQSKSVDADEVLIEEVIEVETLPSIPLPPSMDDTPTTTTQPPSTPTPSSSPSPSQPAESKTPCDVANGTITPPVGTPPPSPCPPSPQTTSPPDAAASTFHITPPASPAQVSTDITSPDMTPVKTPATPVDTPATPATPPISPLTPTSIETPVIRHQTSDTTPVTIPLYDETPDRTRSHSLDASTQPKKIHERRRSSWREYFGFKEVTENETAGDKAQATEKAENQEDDGSIRPVVSFVSKDPVRRASLLQLMASQDTAASVNSTQLNVDVIGWDEDEDPDGSESSKSFSDSVYFDERLYKRSIDLRNSAAAEIRVSEKLSALFPVVDAPTEETPVDSVETPQASSENIPAISENAGANISTVSPSPKKKSESKKWNKKKIKR